MLTIECPELPPIANGTITYAPDNMSDFDVGTIATYQCNNGFILIGVTTRNCIIAIDNTAQWSEQEQMCDRKDL